MTRPWRIQYEGATYRVMSRGAEGEVIFLTEEDYLRFLRSDKFVSWIQKEFVNRKSLNDELPQQRMLADNEVIDRVLEGVMKEFGAERDKIIRWKRCGFEVAKEVGIYLLER